MKKLLWILLLLLPPFISKAYQVSGYISVSCAGGNMYQVMVTDYTTGDPQNSGYCGAYTDLDSIYIHFGDGASGWLYRSNGNIYPPNTFPGGDSVCGCRKAGIYRGLHLYPGPGTYRVWTDGGMRIANINNMINGQDMVLYNTLTIAPITGDSIVSPTIVNPPVCTYGTVGKCYYFNLGAYSPTGDSLSYVLGNCNDASGYFVPVGATLSPKTDSLVWCKPIAPGLYNFSILITTFHKVGTKQYPVDTTEVELEATIDSTALGVNELNDKQVCSVYPNPSHGVFAMQVNSEKGKVKSVVEIYNVLGEKVASRFLIPNSQFLIDLSDKANGIYFYRVITETGHLLGEGKLIKL